MSKIIVKDLELFSTLIYTVTRIVPSCKFIITPLGTSIFTINDGKTIRVALESNSITSDSDIEFCFHDLNKLYKSLNMITSYNKDVNSCELDFDGVMLSYEGDINFKLRTVKSDVIDKFISSKISIELKEVYSFNTIQDNIKKILLHFNIISGSNCKVCIKKKGDVLMCEAGDTSTTYTDNISIPLTIKFNGEFDKPSYIPLEVFGSFFILNAPTTTISMTDKKVFKVTSSLNKGSNFIKLELYCSALKENN